MATRASAEIDSLNVMITPHVQFVPTQEPQFWDSRNRTD
jgi:hypothetical protein